MAEIAPSGRHDLVSMLIGLTLALSFILGPILGGALSKYAHWHWIFLIKSATVDVYVQVALLTLSQYTFRCYHDSGPVRLLASWFRKATPQLERCVEDRLHRKYIADSSIDIVGIQPSTGRLNDGDMVECHIRPHIFHLGDLLDPLLVLASCLAIQDAAHRTCLSYSTYL